MRWQILGRIYKNPLSDQQIQAARALASGMTRSETAALVKCGERTLYRWLSTEEFKEKVDEATTEFWQAALRSLQASSRSAAQYLSRVVSGSEKGDPLRIRAASTILNNALALVRWQEINDLQKRIEDLEEKVQCSKN